MREQGESKSGRPTIDVDGDDTVATADDGIGVVVVAAAVSAAAHGDHPSRLCTAAG